MDESPGMIQQIIDRLRAVAAPPASEEDRRKRDKVAGHKLPISNMDEIDRMSNGLPPIQR